MFIFITILGIKLMFAVLRASSLIVCSFLLLTYIYIHLGNHKNQEHWFQTVQFKQKVHSPPLLFVFLISDEILYFNKRPEQYLYSEMNVKIKIKMQILLYLTLIILWCPNNIDLSNRIDEKRFIISIKYFKGLKV